MKWELWARAGAVWHLARLSSRRRRQRNMRTGKIVNDCIARRVAAKIGTDR